LEVSGFAVPQGPQKFYVVYEFRTDEKFASLNLPKGKHYGLIAQDVEEVLPDLVKEAPQEISGPDDAIKPVPFNTKEPAANKQEVIKVEPAPKEIMNISGINYEELIPILIKAMQEQDAKIDALTQLVEKLRNSSTNSGSQNNVTVNAVRPGGAFLDQNIPAGSTEAQLTITDDSSDTVKRILLNGSGKGVVNIDLPRSQRNGSLFQQKTKARCVSDEKFLYADTAFYYIHQNLMKAGLMKRIEDWEFSSFRYATYVQVNYTIRC
jgi:hypothetical protein